MVKLEFKLEEDDFLAFQIYAASKSQLVAKKKKRSWILLTVAAMVLSLNFVYQNEIFLAIYFGAIALVILLFYPRYINWKYKRHYINFIRENYYNRFGEPELLEFHEGYLFTKDKVGEGNINISEILSVDESSTHFFVNISSGASIIIPKHEVQNHDEIKAAFQQYAIEVNQLN